MRSATWSLRVVVGAMLLLGLMAISTLSAPSSTSAQQAAAAHTAKIIIHKLECPQTTTNLFASCHDNRLAGVPFTVTGVTRQTDANGVVSWGPGAGTKRLREFAAVFNQYGVAYVYCKDQTDGDVLFNGKTFTGDVFITTTAQHVTICDWYNLT
jgi:hypothetical protein